MDSLAASWGLGMIVEAAAQAATEGKTLDEIVRQVRGMLPHVYLVSIVERLDYLEQGKRVSPGQALLGTLLRIKPILDVRGGQVALAERSRTQRRAIDQLMALIQALGPLERAIVLHTEAPDLAEQVADRLQGLVPDWQRCIGQAGVTIASHVGPGAVAIGCITEN